jgi:ubiquitin carboxyl-terminal hydrolase 10
MATLPSDDAGPSRPTSTTSISSSSSIRTVQRQAKHQDDDSFPAITSSLLYPDNSYNSQFWHLEKPTQSVSGITFSLQPSNSTGQVRPRKIATSPYTQQIASQRSSRSHLQKLAQQHSASVTLLENTLKLDSLGVSSSVPDPTIAPKVTLSNTCQPDAKVIFDQSHFTSKKAAADIRRRKPGQSEQDKGSTGTREEDGESLNRSTASLQSQDSEIPSAVSSVTLTSPASTSSYLAANTTATTSFTQPDGDAQSVTSATSSVPASSKKPAWSTPRSWADLASSRVNNSSISPLGAPFSENLDRLQSEQYSSSDLKQRYNSNGKVVSAKSHGPLGLEDIVQHAETRFTAPLTYPRGMINKGNLCFANAILQVLVYCAPFYNLFRLVGNQVAHDFQKSTPLMEAVIYFLSEFQEVPLPVQKSLQESPGAAMDLLRDIQAASEPFVPEYLYDAMKMNKRFDAMRRGHQEDAEEFLGFFLDTLHEELLTAIRISNEKMASKGQKAAAKGNGNNAVAGSQEPDDGAMTEREVKRPVSPVEGDGWLEVGQKGRTSFTRTTSTAHSPITRIFGGKLRSLLRMPGAKDSVTLEPYQPLQLDIQPNHVTTIEEALQNLTVAEVISGVHSASTKGLVDATKQVFIETLPPILVLHLKRFVYDDIGGVQKSSKVVGYGPTLEIPENVISSAKRSEASRRYKLFGVIYHHGRYASGGHYTVDVLKQDQSEWLRIDDTTWSSISAPSVRAGSDIKQHQDGVAYLLFYAREDEVEASKILINGQLSTPPKKTASSAVPNLNSKHRRINSTTSQMSQSSRR